MALSSPVAQLQAAQLWGGCVLADLQPLHSQDGVTLKGVR